MKVIKKISKAILILWLIIIIFELVYEGIYLYDHSKHIVNGYKSKEDFENDDVFQAVFELEKYYYKSSYEEEYKNKTEYKQIGDDKEKIKEYLNIILERWDYQSLIDIDKITEDDYFYLIDDSRASYINNSKFSDYNIDLYIYDNEENILYYIRNKF